MNALITIWTWLQKTILDTFGPSSAYGGPALAGALAFAALYYVGKRRAHGRIPNVRGFVRSIFPRRIVLHPSSVVDMRMWALNGVVFVSAYGVLGSSLFFWRDKVEAGLARAFGAHAPLGWPTWTILTTATVIQLLAYEFAYWFAHYCFHKVPALWEFHKVHHSAEVMTTFTELRQHPVEIVAFVNLIALSTGTAFGVMTYVFGPGVQPFTLLNGNVLLMAFLLTYGHLRHSHMWIPFTGLAGRLLQSPAHHQLHHSNDPAHHDKNLGFALAIWDWAFGTLLIPAKTREPIVLGLGTDNALFRSVAGNFLKPFVRFGGHFTRWSPERARRAGRGPGVSRAGPAETRQARASAETESRLRLFRRRRPECAFFDAG